MLLLLLLLLLLRSGDARDAGASDTRGRRTGHSVCPAWVGGRVGGSPQPRALRSPRALSLSLPHMRRITSSGAQSSSMGTAGSGGSNVISGGRSGASIFTFVGAAYSAMPYFVRPTLKSSSFHPRHGSVYLGAFIRLMRRRLWNRLTSLDAFAWPRRLRGAVSALGSAEREIIDEGEGCVPGSEGCVHGGRGGAWAGDNTR